jgi:hypothetical protein
VAESVGVGVPLVVTVKAGSTRGEIESLFALVIVGADEIERLNACGVEPTPFVAVRVK